MTFVQAVGHVHALLYNQISLLEDNRELVMGLAFLSNPFVYRVMKLVTVCITFCINVASNQFELSRVSCNHDPPLL